jgi:hypothetical protein
MGSAPEAGIARLAAVPRSTGTLGRSHTKGPFAKDGRGGGPFPALLVVKSLDTLIGVDRGSCRVACRSSNKPGVLPILSADVWMRHRLDEPMEGMQISTFDCPAPTAAVITPAGGRVMLHRNTTLAHAWSDDPELRRPDGNVGMTMQPELSNLLAVNQHKLS